MGGHVRQPGVAVAGLAKCDASVCTDEGAILILDHGRRFQVVEVDQRIGAHFEILRSSAESVKIVSGLLRHFPRSL